MSSRTLILGGGFGGLAAANTLRRLLPREHGILVVDRSPDFHVGAGKTWLMLGERTEDEISSPRAQLLEPGIDFVQAQVERIDLDGDAVRTDRGEYGFDQLVIALGAALDMSLVEGLEGFAHTFYTVDGATRLHGALAQFTRGEVAIVIPRVPFKCPPAPYEAALLLDDYFRRRGVRENVSLSIYTAEAAPMATAGPEMGDFVRKQLAAKGVAYHGAQKLAGVDENGHRLVFEGNGSAKCDLLIAVPPHQVPEVVRATQLTIHAGWLPVDYLTLKVTGAPGGKDVYAVGDITAVPLPGRFRPDAPLALPKAGVFAQAHGRIAAHHIAASLTGNRPTDTFDGRGHCYLEVGGQEAVKVEGAFFELPHPVMTKQVPSATTRKEKLRWVAEQLGREP